MYLRPPGSTRTDTLVAYRTLCRSLAARRRREGVEVAATKSTIVDVVTEADREVERLILGRLQDARPDDGVLGEEGASVAGSSGLTRSEEHTSELQSLMRISYAVFCLKKKKQNT